MAVFHWLHLSDLHARLRDDWDSGLVTESLVTDLRAIQVTGFRPDFVFVTGDLAFGATGSESMSDQYSKVRTFMDSVRKAFTPEIPVRDLFVVPGNHDVDRNEITPDQTEWLRNERRTLGEVQAAVRDTKRQWTAWVERLAGYRAFITSYGLEHLEPKDPHLIWTDTKELDGKRIGISGFNSAWSCVDNKDKGQIWCALDWQIGELTKRMGPVDFSIGLIHHPTNWLIPLEDPHVGRHLRKSFSLVLHGHEHTEWLETDRDGHIMLSAGACYECSWMPNGYNYGTIDLDKGEGKVAFRHWDSTGRGWVIRNIAGLTVDGLVPLTDVAVKRTPPPTFARTQSSTAASSVGKGQSAETHYTQRFCQNIIDNYDVLELFGCDIPIELQRHKLSVAYVSLNLSSPTSSPTFPSAVASNANDEAEEELQTSASLEKVLKELPRFNARLVVNGPAGAGKTTLLRWCAIEAAQAMLSISFDKDIDRKTLQSIADESGWRQSVPLLIRLRDCPDGRLPATDELPRFLAKHLPTAPANWMVDVLDSGCALVLLDGVDEVHHDRRRQLADDISALVTAYPACTYIVTTRPGAVDPGWLNRLGFVDARVEPMSRNDREEFISRWYKSAALELRSRPRLGEDLGQTAEHLKLELVEHPEMAALATNPLLCAMICALYRERRENLPETQPELCESLCQMLLHRRERETPGLHTAHFFETWIELHYSQRKALLSDLARTMVNHGTSTILKDEARKLIAKALAATPGRSSDETDEVCQGLVERSGLLRPAGDDRIDFLHNLLKEYLAACAFVEASDWRALARHAEDSAWQPVVLFALALAGESFNTPLVTLLAQGRRQTIRVTTEKPKARSKTAKDNLKHSKAADFFLVRCRSAAKRLDPEISAEIDKIAEDFLPPTTMGEAEALAQIGSRILQYSAANLSNPQWWSVQTCPMAVRCLRLIRRIGGAKARSIVSSIKRLPSGSSQLNAEWMLAISELFDREAVPWPFVNTMNVSMSNTNVSRLEGISALTDLRYLDLAGTRVSDLSVLRNLTEVEMLDIRGTLVADLEYLRSLHCLQHLNIAGTRVESLAPISRLTDLKWIDIDGSLIKDLSPLHQLRELRHLDIQKTRVRDLDPISTLTSLTYLDIQGTDVETLDGVSGLGNLRSLNISSTKISDLRPISRSVEIEDFRASKTAVSDISVLSSFAGLRRVNLGLSNVTALTALAKSRELEVLEIANTRISDLGPVSGFERLRHLSAARTSILDLAPLASCSGLMILDLSRTNVTSIGSLRGMTKLTRLMLQHTKVEDLRPLMHLPLVSLDLRESAVRDLRPLAKVPSLRSLYIDHSITKENIDWLSARLPDCDINLFLRLTES